MPREHSTINMTPEELEAFVGRETRCVLGTLDEQAGPWGDAAATTIRNGALHFRVPASSDSATNIQGDNRVVCVFEEHPENTGYYTTKGAILHGHAKPCEDTAAKIVLDSIPDPVTQKPDPAGATFSISLDDTASFDFAKIKRRFDQ